MLCTHAGNPTPDGPHFSHVRAGGNRAPPAGRPREQVRASRGSAVIEETAAETRGSLETESGAFPLILVPSVYCALVVSFLSLSIFLVGWLGV